MFSYLKDCLSKLKYELLAANPTASNSYFVKVINI